jgi:hypothetical protein
MGACGEGKRKGKRERPFLSVIYSSNKISERDRAPPVAGKTPKLGRLKRLEIAKTQTRLAAERKFKMREGPVAGGRIYFQLNGQS